YTAGLTTIMQDFSTFEGIFHASGATLTVALYVYAKERADFGAAFAIAAILLLLAAVLNLAAAAIRRAGARRRG
ncbi:MAG: phosphate ABC transporter, permease protein PstA, partial [Oscillospiraceae bacterium]|nr:phosphate ABC transporter, permease protein PstA [Oscillospiraceae bacterium]